MLSTTFDTENGNKNTETDEIMFHIGSQALPFSNFFPLIKKRIQRLAAENDFFLLLLLLQGLGKLNNNEVIVQRKNLIREHSEALNHGNVVKICDYCICAANVLEIKVALI